MSLGAHRFKFSLFLIITQIIFLVLFAAFVRYGPEADISKNAAHQKKEDLKEGIEGIINKRSADDGHPVNAGASLNSMYPMFQDVHVMIFIGFGFLMTFLKRYGFGAVGYNFLISAFVIQWSIIVGGVIHMICGGFEHIEIPVGIHSLFEADFTCAAVLISFGALLGKLSGFQLMILSLVEVVIFKINETIGLQVIQASDMGGSMFVHVFGAYFGLAAARVLNRKSHRGSANEGSEYHSDIFSMIGAIFLWLFWPSFNSALATDEERVRSVMNTYIALCSCCVTTFAVSSLVHPKGQLTMAHIQNATLAGGVAVGTCCNMMIHPAGAMFIGIIAGALSVIGFDKIQGFLDDKLGFHDTCGVNNLHGMPGLLAGIAGIVVSFLATDEQYGGDASRVFTDFEGGATQAARQAIALGLTLVAAILGGALTGLLIRVPVTSALTPDQFYNDEDFWEEAEFSHYSHANNHEETKA